MGACGGGWESPLAGGVARRYGQVAMLTFIGCQTRSVDGKGRTPVPMKTRRLLEANGISQLVLALDPDPERLAVKAYTPQGWQEVVQRLAARPLSRAANKVAWRVRASAEPCDIDGAGRILIPQAHRNHLGLSGEVAWVSQGHYLELVEPGSFKGFEELAPEEHAAGAEELRDLIGI